MTISKNAHKHPRTNKDNREIRMAFHRDPIPEIRFSVRRLRKFLACQFSDYLRHLQSILLRLSASDLGILEALQSPEHCGLRFVTSSGSSNKDLTHLIALLANAS